MTTPPVRMMLCLLLCGLLWFLGAPAQSGAQTPPTNPDTAALAQQTPPPATTMHEPGHSEEEIRRARNRISLQIFAASAVLGTIIVISVVVWAQRKRHARALDGPTP